MNTKRKKKVICMELKNFRKVINNNHRKHNQRKKKLGFWLKAREAFGIYY